MFEPSRLTNYNRETLLKEIRRVADKLDGGRAPTHDEFNRESRVHSQTIADKFGTWESAMCAAGLDYVRSVIPKPDLERDLRKVFEIAGGNYFTRDFYKQAGGRYDPRTLRQRLDCATWQELLEKVLSVRKARRPALPKRVQIRRPPISESEQFRGHERGKVESLLSELRLIAEKSHSKVLPYREYRALGGRYAIGTFQQYLPWKKFLSLIGFTDGHTRPRPHLNFSNEDFFRELQRVWEILGRQPKAREMKQNGSRISPQAFQVRFGSWMKAIHAFYEDRRGSESDIQEDPPIDASEPIRIEAQSSVITQRAMKQRTTARVAVIQKATPRQPSLRLRWKVMQRDNFTCCNCGRSPATELGVKLHIDHHDPYSRTGETVFENLRTLCERCNLGKSDLLPSSSPTRA